jgi:hypothetical protein
MTLDDTLSFIKDQHNIINAGIYDNIFVENNTDLLLSIIVIIMEYMDNIFLQYIMAYYEHDEEISDDQLFIVEKTVLTEIAIAQKKLDEYIQALFVLDKTMDTNSKIIAARFNNTAHKIYFAAYRNISRNSPIQEINNKANQLGLTELVNLVDKNGYTLNIDTLKLLQEDVTAQQPNAINYKVYPHSK